MNQFQKILLAISKVFSLFTPAPRLSGAYQVGMYQGMVFSAIAHETFENASIKFWDRKWYTTSMEEWGKIFANVLMEMPAYISNKFDCDNYAFYTSALVSARFKLNTCGVASGKNSEGQAHAFNIFFSEGKFHILEPQTGDIDPDYTVKQIDFW